MKLEHKLTIIGILIAIILGAPALFFQVIYPYWHDHYAIEDTGKTYKNYFLNFQITRPQQDWSFDKNLTNFEQATGITSNDPNILGGVIVESPVRLEGYPTFPVRLVVVLVYQHNNDGTTDPIFIAQHQMKEFQTVFYNTTINITPSATGDDVNVKSIGEKYSQFFYWNERIHKNNDKVYLLSQIWSSNPLLTGEDSRDLNYTFDSFGTIS